MYTAAATQADHPRPSHTHPPPPAILPDPTHKRTPGQPAWQQRGRFRDDGRVRAWLNNVTQRILLVGGPRVAADAAAGRLSAALGGECAHLCRSLAMPLPRSWTLDDVGVVLVRQPQSAPHAWGDPFRQRRRNPTEARYEQGQQVQRIPTLVSGGNRDVWQRGGGGRTNRPLCSGLVRCIASAAGSTTSGVDGAGHRRAASGTIGPTRPLNSSAPREVWGAPAAHATIPALTAAVIEDRIDRACSHTHGESHHPPISIPVPLHLHVYVPPPPTHLPPPAPP